MGGSQTKPTQAQGEYANSHRRTPAGQKGPSRSNLHFFFALSIASQLFMVHLSLLAKCYTVASNRFSSPKRKTITTPISTKPLVVYFKQLSEIFTELLCKHLSSNALPYSSSSTIFLNQINHTVNLT